MDPVFPLYSSFIYISASPWLAKRNRATRYLKGWVVLVLRAGVTADVDVMAGVLVVIPVGVWKGVVLTEPVV